MSNNDNSPHQALSQDQQRLLQRLTAGEITAEEREQLFTAALHSDALFAALAEHEELEEWLQMAEVRQVVLEAPTALPEAPTAAQLEEFTLPESRSAVRPAGFASAPLEQTLAATPMVGSPAPAERKLAAQQPLVAETMASKAPMGQGVVGSTQGEAPKRWWMGGLAVAATLLAGWFGYASWKAVQNPAGEVAISQAKLPGESATTTRNAATEKGLAEGAATLPPAANQTQRATAAPTKAELPARAPGSAAPKLPERVANEGSETIAAAVKERAAESTIGQERKSGQERQSAPPPPQPASPTPMVAAAPVVAPAPVAMAGRAEEKAAAEKKEAEVADSAAASRSNGLAIGEALRKGPAGLVAPRRSAPLAQGSANQKGPLAAQSSTAAPGAAKPEASPSVWLQIGGARQPVSAEVRVAEGQPVAFLITAGAMPLLVELRGEGLRQRVEMAAGTSRQFRLQGSVEGRTYELAWKNAEDAGAAEKKISTKIRFE